MPANRKLIYLINPISGTSKKDVLEKLIHEKTTDAGLAFEILHTNPSGNYTFLHDRILHDGVTDIIMAGGDGTVNQVVSAMAGEQVRFGIIPMGSGNGLAYCAGIPRTASKALDIIFAGHASSVDGIKINGRYSCMLSGLGFDAHVAHEFATKASRGLLTYTQQSLLHYFKASHYQFEVVLDQFSFYTDAFLISIANSNQFGNNFTIAPKASLNDGLIDVVIVQKMNKARLPFAILKQIRGNNKLQQLVNEVTQKNVLYFQTPSLTIRNPRHAPLHIDGEPRPTETEFKIEIVPDFFQLLQPN